MNWTFWTRTKPTDPDDCATLDALLSLYADGAASPEEALRVETHLPGCAACQESLAWMRATRFALASRPVVSPPADLRARIAEAIAASSDAPVPATFRMRRALALRPVLAAAASVAMLGIVGYGLLHHPPSAVVQPVTPPQMASAPPATPAPAATTAPSVKMHLTPRPAVMPKHTRLDSDRVAHSQPDEAVPAPAVVKTHPQVKTDTRMLAEAVMAPDKPHLATTKKPAPRRFRPEMLATNKGLTPAAETHKVPVFKPEPKHTDTVVAEAPRPPAPSIIEKQPIITRDPAPTVAVASSQEGRVQTAEEHSVIRFHYAGLQTQTFRHATIGMVDKDAAYASRTLTSNGMAYIDTIHSR